MSFFDSIISFFTGRRELKNTSEVPSPIPVVLDGYEKAFRNFYGRLGWSVFAIADTNSMDPVFDNGHFLVGEPFLAQTPLNVGDIVVFGLGRIVHRIIDVKGDLFRSRGDNNSFDDGWRNKSEITHVIRAISYVR